MWNSAALLPRRAVMLAGLGTVGTLGSPFHSYALPPKTLMFPRDHGSHPDFKTEWWYITGYATSGEREFGFQVTFFRSRVEATQGMTSKFAAKHLMFAHAAVTDVQGKKLLHDQRIAREGFDVARAATADATVRIGNWSLARQGEHYLANVTANTADITDKGFKLALTLTPTQTLLLQGDKGLSRKGPDKQQASYYYSQPQLDVAGMISIGGTDFALKGPQARAWLDHEWSQALLHPDAVGWDWIGINFFDGSALTAFQLRDKAGKAMWDGGSFRAGTGTGLGSGQRFAFSRGEVVFSRQRSWKSIPSQATYPVEWIVRTPADFYTVKAVIDNQELDSRMSTGAIYWEGLSNVFDSNGRHVGRGYLEMTGYASALRI